MFLGWKVLGAGGLQSTEPQRGDTTRGRPRGSPEGGMWRLVVCQSSGASVPGTTHRGLGTLRLPGALQETPPRP